MKKNCKDCGMKRPLSNLKYNLRDLNGETEENHEISQLR